MNLRPRGLRICFYAPFKPLGHRDPSGDLVVATGLYRHLCRLGHTVRIASGLRTRWIFWRPWLWPVLLREQHRLLRRVSPANTDLWFTYHSYYKGPDLLGPLAAVRRKIPYVVFQGIYSTKRGRKILTWPGFMLNRRALLAAAHVLTNKRVDLRNLRRLLPADRVTYVAPGIETDRFRFDAAARRRLRTLWQVGEVPVILAAAMFRSDVKTRGLVWLIETCGRLREEGLRFQLVVAGDGIERPTIERCVRRHLPEGALLVGKVPRPEMPAFYSAGDVFAFPGINESLGMVYLEAQSCGLPVVAFRNAGVPAVVRDGDTGVLTAMYDRQAYGDALKGLLNDAALRAGMGRAAAARVRRDHDIDKNYQSIGEILNRVAAKGPGAG